MIQAQVELGEDREEAERLARRSEAILPDYSLPGEGPVELGCERASIEQLKEVFLWQSWFFICAIFKTNCVFALAGCRSSSIIQRVNGRCFSILLWLATFPAFAATFDVTVKVVDADAKPVSKADVALSWRVKLGMTPDEGRQAVTDENGKAVLTVDDWNEKRPVLVLSQDRARGAIVSVSRDDESKEVVATLGPTGRVKGSLGCKELNFPPKWANTMVTVEGLRAPIAQDMGTNANFEFVLPAGKYTLSSYGTDVEGIKQSVTVVADRAEFDLGTLDLKASALAKLKGKPAPGWDITAARGVKSSAKLSDYKGKWVYLEFWGFW
jgi:hypothetical protein